MQEAVPHRAGCRTTPSGRAPTSVLHCVMAANPSPAPLHTHTHTHTRTRTHTQHMDTDIQGCWGARQMLSNVALETEKNKESVSH